MTAPLTPPDCNLRGLPFMPLDVVRLMESDLFALSTGEQFKAAVALWCKSWTQVPAASLPDDDRILARLIGLSPLAWSKVSAVAMRGWAKCSDGRLYHPVVAEKAVAAWAARGRQRDRAAKRWQSHGNATALPRQCKGEGEGELREEDPIQGLSCLDPGGDDQPTAPALRVVK